MSFAILNSDGEHLGFLLLAGEDSSGDCIFRSLPSKAELFDTEASKVLYRLQEQGEFSWQKTENRFEVSAPDQTLVASIENQSLQIGGIQFQAVDLNAS